MLERYSSDKGGVDDEGMGKLSEKHLNQIEKWLEKQSNIDILYVSYNDIIKKLCENAEIVNQFLGACPRIRISIFRLPYKAFQTITRYNIVWSKFQKLYSRTAS